MRIMLFVVGVLSAADAAEPDEPWLSMRFIGLGLLLGDRRPVDGDRKPAEWAGLFLDMLPLLGHNGV